MFFSGSVCWAASQFRLELPELERVADVLKEVYEPCREGAWGVNSELAYYYNTAAEPSLGNVMQRMLDATANMGDEERDIARVGIENCMGNYAAGEPIEVPPTARPSTAASSRMRRTPSAVMPPPYDPSLNYLVKM